MKCALALARIGSVGVTHAAMHSDSSCEQIGSVHLRRKCILETYEGEAGDDGEDEARRDEPGDRHDRQEEYSEGPPLAAEVCRWQVDTGKHDLNANHEPTELRAEDAQHLGDPSTVHSSPDTSHRLSSSRVSTGSPWRIVPHLLRRLSS